MKEPQAVTSNKTHRAVPKVGSCDSHQHFLTRLKADVNLNKLVKGYSSMFSITKQERRDAYALLDEVIKRRLYKNVYLAVKALFPLIDDDAAQKLYAAYRKYKQRQREAAESDDRDMALGKQSEDKDTTPINIEELCDLISRIHSLTDVQVFHNAAASRLKKLRS